MPHRFFIDPANITPPTVTLGGDIARQLKTVLRMLPGETIVVLDNSGREYTVTLTEVEKQSVRGQIIAQRICPAEPGLHLTLYQGTLKAQKFEWVLQKGTELGVSRFVPVICQRSVVNKAEAVAGKYARWADIIREAAEQSGRGRLPELAPAMPWPDAVRDAQSAALALIPWEEAPAEHTLRAAIDASVSGSIVLFIGPEGGFSAPEVALAQAGGVQAVTLGPRILRAETAGLAACAAIMFHFNQW
jgi:16S rRNA (uracil1498-N3)-methyltransferase